MKNTSIKPFRAPREAHDRAKPQECNSEEPTELGVVCERYVRKETQESVANRRGPYELWENVRKDKETVDEWESRIDKEEMERSGSNWTMAKERALAEENYIPHECAKVQSPCVSEFEEFLDKNLMLSENNC
jgi:hypothetical protein